MHARRGHADDDVACPHVVSLRKDVPALDGADGKPPPDRNRPWRIGLGTLRGLAADQGATGIAAGFGDAFHDDRRIVDIELSARVVVEEEQRFGALQIDDVVSRTWRRGPGRASGSGASRWRSGAWCRPRPSPRTSTGPANPAALRSKSPPKPPSAASAPGRRVAFAKWAISVDQRVAAVDIDAGVLIGEGNSRRDQEVIGSLGARARAAGPVPACGPEVARRSYWAISPPPASLVLPLQRKPPGIVALAQRSSHAAHRFRTHAWSRVRLSFARAHAADDPFTVSGISVDASAASAIVARVSPSIRAAAALEHAL